MPRENKLNQEQQQIVDALLGATEAVCCAIEAQTISATQVQCLYQVLIKQLKTTFH